MYDGANYITLKITGAERTYIDNINYLGHMVGHYLFGGIDTPFYFDGLSLYRLSPANKICFELIVSTTSELLLVILMIRLAHMDYRRPLC